MKKYRSFEFLGIKWCRIGYVTTFSVFGFVLYKQCGQVCELFGMEWINE